MEGVIVHTGMNNDCLKDATGKRDNAKCSFVRFPRHPQTRMRSPCETPLLKLVKTSSHKYLYKLIKVFRYRSVIKSIQEYVQHEQYVVLFNHWKQRVGISPDPGRNKSWSP